MKITNKIKTGLAALIVTLFATVPILATQDAANAVGEGQIEGGDIYRVRNVTKGGDFTDPVGADPCNLVQYKVRIHNPGPSPISNVKVKVDLPSSKSATNVSSVTVSASDAFPQSTSDTATVNLSKAEVISYVSGTTELLNANGGFISTLPDGITSGGSGVDIGNVGVSIGNKRFVQFKAKVNCEKPPCEENPNLPECKPPCEVNPNLPQCKPPCEVNPDLPQCQECVKNPDLPQCKPACEANPELPQCKPLCEVNPDAPECQPGTTTTTTSTPSNLPDTGPGEVAAVFVIVSAAGAAAYQVVLRRLYGA